MSKSDEYRAKSDELRRFAEQAGDPKVRETYAGLADTWEKLAADTRELERRRENPPGS